MPNIVTNDFKIYNADQFAESLGESANSVVYMFIGRPYSWSDENTPPAPNNNPIFYFEYWDDMIAMRRVGGTDVKNVVPRYDWVSGTVYAEYDTIYNLYSTNFYVLTSQFNVYKCISNNKGAQSTVQPTGTSVNVITTADGYRWKYLYSLSETDVLKFLTTEYMAVHVDNTISAVAIDGGIHHLKLTANGSGYSNVANLVVTIYGDGANANVSANISGGVVTGFTINNPGQNYRVANVSITGGGGTGAAAIPVISPAGGHGYDPKSELGGYFVMVNGRFNYASGYGDFPVQNEYRRIGLIREPKSSRTGHIATEKTLNTNYTLSIGGTSGSFQLDEYIVGLVSGANARVVTSNIMSNVGYVRYLQANAVTSNFKQFSVGEVIIGQNSSAYATVTRVTAPEAVHDTGKIIYVNNRTPITRRSDQAENIHIVIEF